KQDRLFAILESFCDCRPQIVRQNGGRILFATLLTQINDADLRHLLCSDPLSERSHAILASARVVITFKRRRGATEQDNTFRHFCADDGYTAGVIPRRVFLFVSAL